MGQSLGQLGSGVSPCSAPLYAWLAEKLRAHRRAIAWTLLLWLPVPFYAWSVAYGSVPIFFPAWWPFTWYNTRYGLELLPALALGLGFAVQFVADSLRRITAPSSRFVLPNLALAFLFALAGLNVFALLRAGPIVYVESTKNAQARKPYDNSIPPALQSLLTLDPHATVLMNTSIYPEIVAFTGIPLRQTINESDLGIYRSALAIPPPTPPSSSHSMATKSPPPSKRIARTSR